MLPEFLQRRKELRRRAESPSTESPSRKNDSVIQRRSPLFWKLLLKEFELTVGLLPEINFTGSISPFGTEIVRVSLNDDSAPPISTRTDLVLDGDRIRCSVLNGGIYYLNFTAVSDTEIGVQDIQTNSDIMDARKTAEYVMDRMLNILEWIRG